jgi:hypothetical protein
MGQASALYARAHRPIPSFAPNRPHLWSSFEAIAKAKLQSEAKRAGATLGELEGEGPPPSQVLGAMRRDRFRCRHCGTAEALAVSSMGLKFKGYADPLDNLVTGCKKHAGRQGLVPVEREVTRAGKSYRQIFWVKPEQVREGDRKLEGDELTAAHRAAMQRDDKRHGNEATKGLPVPATPKFETNLYKLDWSGTPAEAIARNHDAMVKSANEFVSAIHQSAGPGTPAPLSSAKPSGVGKIVVAELENKHHLADFNWSTNTLCMSPETAKDFVEGMRNGLPSPGVQVFLHESAHAATLAMGNTYEGFHEAKRPFADLQESATEILAQHHVAAYFNQTAGAGLGEGGQVTPPKMFSLPGSERGITRMAPTAYPDEVERFGRLATLALGLHTRQEQHGLNSAQAQSAIVGFAQQLKQTMALLRYEHIGAQLAQRLASKAKGEARDRIARVMAGVAQDYMSGGMGQEWTKLVQTANLLAGS